MRGPTTAKREARSRIFLETKSKESNAVVMDTKRRRVAFVRTNGIPSMRKTGRSITSKPTATESASGARQKGSVLIVKMRKQCLAVDTMPKTVPNASKGMEVRYTSSGATGCVSGLILGVLPPVIVNWWCS